MTALLAEGKWEEVTPFPCEENCPYHFMAPLSFANIRCPLTILQHIPAVTPIIEQAIYRMYGPLTTAQWYRLIIHSRQSIVLLHYLLETDQIHLQQPEMMDCLRYSEIRGSHMDYLIDKGLDLNLPMTDRNTLLLDLLQRDFIDPHPEEDDSWDNPRKINYILRDVQYLLRHGSDPLLPGRDGQSPLSYVEGLRSYPKCQPILLKMIRQVL